MIASCIALGSPINAALRVLTASMPIVLSVLCLPAAALSGSVSGSVLFDDDMGQQCGGTSGCIFSDMGDHAGLPAIRVRLKGGFGQTIGEAQTNANGAFLIQWSDSLLTSFPSSGYKLWVTTENVDDWRVTDSSDQIYAFEQNVTVSGSNVAIGAMDLGSNEAANVHALTWHFWEATVNTSSILSARMTSVRISVNTDPADLGCPDNSTSCSPSKNHSVIDNQAGFTDPIWTVAHELGHLASWHALESWNLNGGLTTGCDGSHFWNSANGCEKVAWHEGLADFFATATQWGKNTADSSVVYANPTAPVGQPASNCSAASSGHSNESCHAAAFWDLYDDPTSDDDQIDDSQENFNIATIVNILDQYANGFANRENDESGNDGRNHWDFLENLDDLLSEAIETDARSIFVTSDLCSGDGPYGSC